MWRGVAGYGEARGIIVSEIRDRVVELVRVRAGDLRPNPDNWRTHTRRQKALVKQMMGRIGIANAVMARRLWDGGLELIDGHLRADIDPDMMLPCLIVDLDNVEAREVLITYDPIKGMAEPDHKAFASLMRQMEQEFPTGVLVEVVGVDLGPEFRIDPNLNPSPTDVVGSVQVAQDLTYVRCPECGEHFVRRGNRVV